MSQKKLLCIALLILGKIALVQLKVCPDEYTDTGQINALVVWNGNISNGDTLPYCRTWTNCTIAFHATSEHSPSVDIDGGCYAVSEMNAQFPGSVMNDTQHPYYNFKFHCRNIKHLRLVFSQTEYTKEYKLESSNVLCNGTLVTTAPDGTSSGSPSNTPSVTPPNSRTVVDCVAIAIGTTVTLAVALAVFIPLIVIAVVICLWRRKKTNSDDSASYSSGGNDTSSISERGNSMRRDVGDGEEETTHPLSVTATNGNGITKMVTGKGSSC